MANKTLSASSRTQRRVLLTVAAYAALTLAPWMLPPAHSQTPDPAAMSERDKAATMPAGDKQISGSVVNEKKQPVAGILVGLNWDWSVTRIDGAVSSGSGPVAQTTTDAHGRFAFRNLPARNFDYAVYSMTNDYVMQGGPLNIRAGDTQKTLRIILSHGSLVTGRVVDKKTGKPVADAVVQAGPIPPGGNMTNWVGWNTTSFAKTDAQGHYQIRVISGNIFVSVGRSVGSSASSQRILAAACRVVAPAGKTVAAPSLSVLLRPMFVCVGPDGQPIARTPIRLITGNLAQGGSITEATTDKSGAVVLGRNRDALRPDSGAFSIIKGDLAASGTFHWSSDGPLVIMVNGQESRYPDGVGTLKLLPGSTSPVTGTVVSENGTPIPNALVRVYETDPRSHYGLGSKEAKADAAGTFRLPLDPNGQYQAYVRADGFNQVSVSDKPLSVVPGKPTDLGAIHLLRADGFITGTVVDTAGKPMAGVLTNVRDGKTGVSAAVTDVEGKFRIPNVVIGERLTLHLCRHGEAPDSGQAWSQSNEEMNIPDAYASPSPIKVVWRPKQ